MTIAVYYHKGGTSKTITTGYLGKALKGLDHSGLFVDLDSQTNYLGIEKTDVAEVLLRGKSVIACEPKSNGSIFYKTVVIEYLERIKKQILWP